MRDLDVTQPHLSLWDKVIFVDWHGVMSKDPFWESVLALKDKLGSGLRSHLSNLFGSDSEVVDGWMRGEVSTSEVVEPTQRYLGERRLQDFLERRIVEDCRTMSVDVELALVLASLRDRVLIVLATDNTIEFERVFRAAKVRSRVPPQTRDQIDSTLNQVARNFDDILCSASIGVLKAEDPQAFFGSWLSENSLRFGDSLLIDDRADNCQAFRRLGGRALNWDDSASPRTRRLALIRKFASSGQEVD